MATWKLSPQYKKSAIEKMFFYKDGKSISVEQGFRWGTFSVESDERPLTDEELVNKDGYELGCLDNDECWEMWDMIDGCWCFIEIENDNTTSTDVEEFEAAWEEDGFSGVEELGWFCDDTEYFYVGPLELTNEDTGEVYQGEPTEEVPIAEPSVMEAVLEELIEEEESTVTEWYPKTVKPVYVGQYQIVDEKEEVKWPFPSNVKTGNWDGKKWDVKVTKWRGLSKDPNA